MAKTTIDSLKRLGAVEEDSVAPRRLIAVVRGWDKTGKNHFAYTAPEPVVTFSLDRGSEGVVEKFKATGKRMVRFDFKSPDPPPVTDKAKVMAAQKDAVATWEDFRSKLYAAYDLGEGTVIIDTESAMYMLARLAWFGKLSQVPPNAYDKVYAQLNAMIGWAKDAVKMNTVYLQKIRWKFESKPPEEEIMGYAQVSYEAQAVIQMHREIAQVEEAVEGGDPMLVNRAQFSAYIDTCRQNANCMGQWLQGDDCNFMTLLDMVHGPA